MFDIQAARESGYSDVEITDYLAQNHPNFDVHNALKSGYSLDEIASELNNPTNTQEKPGTLKSAALGLMSGIPLAETAVAGVNALGPSTYEEEHRKLEGLKDQAWEEHPVAYGAGKTAGIVGTGIAAPASIPGAIALGAASGVDAASNLSEIPQSALKGGVVGGALGVAGEKVLSPLISKAIPAAAKKTLGILTGGTENVETYLANREGVNTALKAPEAAEKLANLATDVRRASGQLSEKATSLLSEDTAPIASIDDLKNIVNELNSKFTQNGVPKTASDETALKALASQYDRLVEIAKTNGGTIPETTLKEQIQALQNSLKANTWGNPDAAASQDALRALSGKLNSLLKESNPAYKEAIKPSAEMAGLAEKVGDKFALDAKTGGTMSATEATNTKMVNVLKEGKTESQEALKSLADLTGFDFLENAELDRVRQAFESGGHSNPILNVLGHVAGFGAGALSGIPGGRLIGSLLGGAASHALDGGQIAKGLLDTYLNGMESLTDSGAKATLTKYGPILVNAARTGGNQLAATHFVLATSHPEYQDLIRKAQE